MKKMILVASIALALTACKKKDEVAPQETVAPISQAEQAQIALNQFLNDKKDWTLSLANNLDAIMLCSNSGHFQTKYVFKASNQHVLLKGEDDVIYVCALSTDSMTPHYQEIAVPVDPKSARFYPGELPKADSCLNNTRIVDKTGHTAGWLSKITC